MSLKFRLAFLVIVGAQVLLLLGLIADREYTLRAGVDVVLETLPIDPRSLLQGDYVVLRYEIAQIPEDWEGHSWTRSVRVSGRGSRKLGTLFVGSSDKTILTTLRSSEARWDREGKSTSG